MKVFINKPSGDYVGGLIVVAANSALEAHGVMCAEDENLTYYYEPYGWHELKGVISDAKSPCVWAHGEHEG